MAELMPYVALLAGLWVMTAISGLLMSHVFLPFRVPNWLKAIRSLPVPRDVGERSGWKSSWFRDRPGTKAFTNCVVSYSEQGVLVRDFWYQAFLRGLFSKHRTMFIPWTACSNPREPWRHRWYAVPSQRRLVEFDVAGQHFSIFLDPRKVREFRLGGQALAGLVSDGSSDTMKE